MIKFESPDLVMITLHPIGKSTEDNLAFLNHPESRMVLTATMEYYTIIGFNPPWIGYFAKFNDEIVGSGGYKGKPVDNKIEIAYGTFPAYQRKGIGTAICKALVELAIETDPGLIITARTLPENNYSTKILQKNNFLLLGMIWDEDDGDVWEWQYQK